MTDAVAEANGIRAGYEETAEERVLTFEHDDTRATVAQNREGYAMVKVRDASGELERYYGFDIALEHVADLLGVAPTDLPVPDAAADMGM